jgi:hypothetical protein
MINEDYKHLKPRKYCRLCDFVTRVGVVVGWLAIGTALGLCFLAAIDRVAQ